MALTTIIGFSEQIGVPPETLVKQLAAAGIDGKLPADSLTDEEKETLFRYLRTAHGSVEEKKKITLKRKSTTSAVQSSRTGGTRTVQVEVRKKRTFVKRSDVESAAEPLPELAAEEEALAPSEPVASLATLESMPAAAAPPVATPESAHVPPHVPTT